MHIAILNDSSNFHTQKWAKNIQAAGAKVSIISFDSYQHSEIPCIYVQPRFARNGNPNLFTFMQMGKTFAAIFKKEKIDVVLAINATPFGILARKTGFHPTIVLAFGMDILEFPPKDKVNQTLQSRNWTNIETNASFWTKLRYSIRYAIVRKEVKKALDNADLIMGDNLVLTNAVAQWFEISTEKVKLNRGGVEPELFEVGKEKMDQIRQKYHIPSDKKIVLVPRGLKPIYQADIIVDAIEILLKQGRVDTYFIVLGTYAVVAPSLDTQLHALSQQSNCLFYQKETLEREEMYALWNSVDAFISAPIYDGYSAAVAEGRYAGAVPIVNDTPATRELFIHQENGWIVPDFTAQNLSNELTKLLDDLLFWKDKFAHTNKSWVERESLMLESGKKVVQWAAELLAKRN
jgi:glycosyltransferase involved in cell wall biosynthesis